MTVRVRAATTGEDLEAWITFPRRFVYGTRSPWVPPLDGDLRRMLDRRKNPFFRHGTALPLLATDGTGRPLGRILAHVYHRHNVRHGERAAFFGYFECRGDPGAAQALVAAAAELGAQHGCTILRGPFNMTAMQEMGILVEGFDAAPAVDETYTAPYYPALLRGGRPAGDLSACHVPRRRRRRARRRCAAGRAPPHAAAVGTPARPPGRPDAF